MTISFSNIGAVAARRRLTRVLHRGWARCACPLLATFLLLPLTATAAETARPMIWVTAADRAPILAKIESQPWARACFEAMKARVADAVAAHQRDPDAYLRGLPLVPDSADFTRHPTFALIGGNMAGTPGGKRHHSLQRYLHVGTDCAVLFYLTGNESYARCAADILHVAVEALVQMPRNDATEQGGIVYPGDVLYEARAVGAQLPIIYDFLCTRLEAGATVYNLVAKSQVPFPFDRAQQVFRSYARLIIEHGQTDSNHPVLEMPCLALNALAVDDPAERARLLEHVVSRDTRHQDSLQKVMRVYATAGGLWPESFQYSSGVSTRVTYLTALLRRQSPPAVSIEGFAQLPLSLVRLTDFRFPNGENIRFGDGPRRSGQPYESLEIAYALAVREEDAELQRAIGSLINLGIAEGKYDRSRPHGFSGGAESYQGPLQLLWFAPRISGQMTAPAPRTTDELPFVGAVLQRNLPPNGDPAHALMAVVSGGAHVHSHASGMALELYGAGQVLGANAGKGTYTTDEHENYRRLFAAHNGVIVNGASRSAGGWVNLGIATVEKIALEPAIGTAPVSPNHSFTLTRFADDKGDGARAKQERLVGIVRNSATTGYYVDVFRSKSARPNQFHDYLYHNLGDTLELSAADHPLTLADSPSRFVPVAGATWDHNRAYLFPGWHVFKSTRTSAPFAGDVAAEFTAAKLKPTVAAMRLFLPGNAGREYSTALAPVTREAPPPYDKAPTPVLVIRQRGEAWDHPFAVIYEPRSAASTGDAGGIQSVTALTSRSGFAGFKVVSKLAGHSITQLVLVLPAADSTLEDPALGLSFRGRYAVVTLDERGTCTALYLGEGSRLRCQGVEFTSAGAASAAAAEINGDAATLTSNAPAELRLPSGRRIAARIIGDGR